MVLKTFIKFLWKPEADYVHQPLQALRPFVSVRVPLLYRFAPSADKWQRYQPETDFHQRNQWRGTALWYMPTEWITQFPKEVTPNAIFGMCPKSVCTGTVCQVYHFKGYLYCDHGFTDNEDAHRGLNFQFTSYLPKDPKKVEERIINFFPITVMKACYRIQDSAKIYCPKAVRHTVDTPVFIFDGNFYCVHGYTSIWATNPEKYPLAVLPQLSDYWLKQNEEMFGEPESKQSGSDSMHDCQNKLAQMNLSPTQEDTNKDLKQEEVAEPRTPFDTPNTVTIQNAIPRDEVTKVKPVKIKHAAPSSSLSVLQNYHKYLKDGNEPLEFYEYKTKFAPELGKRCIHGYLPIDGNICKSVKELSACVGRCLQNQCDYRKDFHCRTCPKIKPKRASDLSREIGRKGSKQLLVGFGPSSEDYQTFNLPKRIDRFTHQKVTQKLKSNRTHPRRLDRFGKDPFISTTIHTDPELCPRAILKIHNTTYPYNSTADSLNDLH